GTAVSVPFPRWVRSGKRRLPRMPASPPRAARTPRPGARRPHGTKPRATPSARNGPAVTAPALGRVESPLVNHQSTARTYLVRTLGCQMNVHDSERMSGMLDEAGYVNAGDQGGSLMDQAEAADVVVINTCAVRENAAERLYGNLGQLAKVKKQRPDFQIAVGGCLAQQDRAGIVERAPWVDVVFGTHNLDVLPVMLERARHNGTAQVEIEESLKVFPSTLPTRRE